MIVEYIDRFREIKEDLHKSFMETPPECYSHICTRTLKMMFEDSEEYSGVPDYDTIHVIDDGDYQGTYLFLIPEKTYQPHDYYLIKVWYGSCSGCDTFQANELWSREDCTEQELIEEADGNVTMALHMIESIKKV